MNYLSFTSVAALCRSRVSHLGRSLSFGEFADQSRHTSSSCLKRWRRLECPSDERQRGTYNKSGTYTAMVTCSIWPTPSLVAFSSPITAERSTRFRIMLATIRSGACKASSSRTFPLAATSTRITRVKCTRCRTIEVVEMKQGEFVKYNAQHRMSDGCLSLLNMLQNSQQIVISRTLIDHQVLRGKH